MSADQKIIKAQSDMVWSKGVRQVFRVSLASGRVLRATGNHRVFTGDGWRKVKQLVVGSRVAVARQFPSSHYPGRLVGRADLPCWAIWSATAATSRAGRYGTPQPSEANSQLVTESARRWGVR